MPKFQLGTLDQSPPIEFQGAMRKGFENKRICHNTSMEGAVKIPDSVRAVLWSYDTDRIDVEAHKKLIVTQVLNFGTEDAVKWLFRLYGREEVARVANEIPLGQWDKKSLSLWSLVLGIAPRPREQRFGSL